MGMENTFVDMLITYAGKQLEPLLNITGKW